MEQKIISVGIDDIAIHFPRLYLDMKDFAELRGADFNKLNKGLGLKAMAIPDVHEDTATMGAMAVMRLIDRNRLDLARLEECILEQNPHWMVQNQLRPISLICLLSVTQEDMAKIVSEIVMLLI